MPPCASPNLKRVHRHLPLGNCLMSDVRKACRLVPDWACAALKTTLPARIAFTNHSTSTSASLS
eukprot:2409378-Rhodomonas_salina.2